MIQFDLNIPTYAEWKAYLKKLNSRSGCPRMRSERIAQKKKLQKQIQQFCKDFLEDQFNL